MGLMEVLGDRDVAIDAGPLIYWFENHDELAPVLEPLFAAAERDRPLVASQLVLLEVLTGPLGKGDHVLADRLERALLHCPCLDLVPISRAVLVRAAELRAEYRVKTPDALHLATALLGGCGAFVTNDRRIPDIEGLRIIRLRDLL
jgi:predicted nucleic acid-binding protein